MVQLLILMIERICFIATIAFILTRSTTFRNLIDNKANKKAKLVLTLFFGLFGIIGTYTGIPVKSTDISSMSWMSDAIKIPSQVALANSRVVGVLVGGLLGGPLVGLGAGIIAGLHRAALGGFSALACGVSTATEGLIGGIVNKKLGTRRIVSVGSAFVTGILSESIQMVIILLMAKPFAEAWNLVETIALPMIFANSIGVAIFIAIIRSVVHEEDRIEANQAQKVLHIADEMLVHLRKGFNFETATEISKLLLKNTGVSAVSITDKEKILSHVGLGSDHHIPGHAPLTEATKKVLKTGNIYEPRSYKEIGCSVPNCPLATAIIIPIKESGKVIGALKFYFSNPKQLKPVDDELAQGLGRLLAHQVAIVKAEKQSKLVSEAEIKALQAQVNPHFLFNSFNTITALIRTQPDMARKLLIQLGNFFRQNLNASLHELISLRRDLNHTEAYLNVEQARFLDRMHVKIEIEPQLENVLLPPLTLQPLVENAVVHGLKEKSTDWLITIKAVAKGSFACISVEDNGIGIEPARIGELLQRRVKSQEGTGLGLYNVNQRLSDYFGEESGLHIESEPGGGTFVWFLIPRQKGATGK